MPRGRLAKEPDTSTFVGQIAAEIRRRREKKKLLVAETAAAAGVPVQTWYHWEQAHSLPLDRLPAIAAALGCKPRDLVPK
jgi:transcriptional regulator with XRE-family HTH domain